MYRRAALLGMGLILLAGCVSPTDSSGESPGPTDATASGSGGGNGTVYVSDWGSDRLTITGQPINVDGTVGAATEVLAEEADESTFAGIVDGIGDLVLIGKFTEYWTTEVSLRRGADLVRQVTAPQWCGGEGLVYNVCVLLDETRLARTTELGGEDAAEGSVLVSSLETGKKLAEFGPFAGLAMVLPTDSSDRIFLVTGKEGGPSLVSVLDLTDGTTTQVGESPEGWAPLCPIGSDSVLGFNSEGTPTATVVGPAQAAKFSWDADDSLAGCSADGRFVYVQRIPQPPTDEVEDTEPPNPPTELDRIAVSDGTRGQVLVLDPGLIAGPVTR
ncbi:MAG: hypothetical protein WCF04_04715 [Candidatus Nanopelagicales bacterium]